MNKLGLRLQMIERRGQLTADQVAAASVGVTSQLTGLLDWSKVGTLHSYESSDAWNEIRTEPFFEFLKRSYPAVHVTRGSTLKDGPIPGGQFDVVLVPLLGFDSKRNRLGFGGGWYDKFLATQLNAVTIGLAYDFQLVGKIPVEPHDVKLALVVTESGVYR